MSCRISRILERSGRAFVIGMLFSFSTLVASDLSYALSDHGGVTGTPTEEEPAPNPVDDCEAQCLAKAYEDWTQCVEKLCSEESAAAEATLQAEIQCLFANGWDQEMCSAEIKASEKAREAYNECIGSESFDECTKDSDDEYEACVAACSEDSN